MLAIVVAVGLGIGLGFILDSGPSHLDVISETPSGPGPSDEVNGVPVGYSRTEAGAVAAATNFGLLSTMDSFWGADRLPDAMEVLAAPQWREEARQQATSGYEFITRRYGKDVELSGAALRYQVLEFSPDRAAVNLWILTVISGARRATVDEIWGTATVRLGWIEEDWRVIGTENETGPAPVQLPADGLSEDARLFIEELDEYSGAPTP